MAGHAPEIAVPKAPKAKVAIISSSWHLDICNDLIAGATRALDAAEVAQIETIYVPGSLKFHWLRRRHLRRVLMPLLRWA